MSKFPNCHTCNSNQCIYCAAGYYWDGTQCIACAPGSTPAVSIIFPGIQSCMLCDIVSSPACIRCISDPNNGLAVNCTTCDTGYYLWTTQSSTVTCQACDAGYVGCATCTTQGCLTCETSYSLYQSGCVAQCPNNTYASGAPSQCTPCGSKFSHCDLCNTDQCLQCSAGYYWNGASCALCDSSCGTCASAATYCTSCPTGSGKVTYDGQCLGQCPNLTYVASNPLGGAYCAQCSAFSPDCVACTSLGCTWCGTTYLWEGRCFDQCPTSTFAYGPSGNATTCTACNGNVALVGTQCTHCADPSIPYYYPGDGNCYAICPTGTIQEGLVCVDGPCMENGTFYNTTTGTCIPCDNLACMDCRLGTNICIDCGSKQGYIIPLNDGSITCVAACPQGFTTDLVTMACIPCAQDCPSCLPNNLFSPSIKFGQKFIPSVEWLWANWLSASNTVCAPCNDSNSITYYSTCAPLCPPTGTYRNGEKCAIQCPGGTYPLSDIPFCVACPTGCTDCSSIGCDLCMPGFSNYEGICVPECPFGTYGYKGVCTVCSPECSECQDYGTCTGMMPAAISNPPTCLYTELSVLRAAKGVGCI